MGHRLRYILHRSRRLSLTRLAAAAVRKGCALVNGLATEARARTWGTTIGDRDLRRALRAKVRGAPEPFLGSGDEGGRFFVDPDLRERLGGLLRIRHPEAVASIIGAAEDVCSHRFDLLGSGPTDLGPQIDWYRDFKSAYRWNPKTFYTRIRYGHVAGADVKVPWELSRFQHLATLGKAYWLTGDERYAAEFVGQVRHWIAENPPQFGVNWVCSMDIAIRAFNWLWGYAFFRTAPTLSAEFRREFAGALLAHGRHILRNLEKGADGITSNHYLADLVGLAGLGIACPAFREAADWRRLALAEIVREMDRQVQADGTDYESSIPYHRLVLEIFLAVAVLCRKNGLPLPADFLARLERMLDFAACYTKPSGLAPQVGDNDDGRLHILADYGGWDPRDHRHVLATGGVFFGRADLAAAAGGRTEEAIWLCGEGVAAGDGEVRIEPASRGFPDGGVYIMRHRGLYLLVSCGPVGTGGIGNHKHNDLLGFELNADGQDLLVDPGSFVYTPDPVWRNRFRSTAVHNTVMIDGEEQNRFGEGGLFWLHPDATPGCLAWETGPEQDRFVGEHDGYARLADPIIHRREIRLHKAARTVEVADDFLGVGWHLFVWNFTFAPGVRVRPAGDKRWEMIAGAVRAVFCVTGSVLGEAPDPVRPELVEAFYSPHYGIKVKTTALRLHLGAGAPLGCRFRIEVT